MRLEPHGVLSEKRPLHINVWQRICCMQYLSYDMCSSTCMLSLKAFHNTPSGVVHVNTVNKETMPCKSKWSLA